MNSKIQNTPLIKINVGYVFTSKSRTREGFKDPSIYITYVHNLVQDQEKLFQPKPFLLHST